MQTVAHWIDNTAFAGTSSAAAPVTNPATGEVTGHVALASVEDARAVIAAAAAVVYRLYFWPEAEVLPVPTQTVAAPTATLAPIAVPDASAFLASLPTVVGVDVLTELESVDVTGDETLPARTAEHHRLSYGASKGATDFTVDAYQHYTSDDATTAYEAYAGNATDVENVEVGGLIVGERAYSTEGTAGTVVWRNNTAVFVLTGPADKVLDFYARYGV